MPLPIGCTYPDCFSCHLVDCVVERPDALLTDEPTDKRENRLKKNREYKKTHPQKSRYVKKVKPVLTEEEKKRLAKESRHLQYLRRKERKQNESK